MKYYMFWILTQCYGNTTVAIRQYQFINIKITLTAKNFGYCLLLLHNTNKYKHKI